MASPSVRPRRRGAARLAAIIATTVMPLALAACGSITISAPAQTPTDFAGLAGRLAVVKISVDNYVSGDAGCKDPDLVPSAVSFYAQGLDQPTPVKLYWYWFRNHDAFVRHSAQVGPCARAYVTDASTFREVDESPYVLAGQGPWAPAFEAALRRVLAVAAGTGG
jgi:hypothetical protein